MPKTYKCPFIKNTCTAPEDIDCAKERMKRTIGPLCWKLPSERKTEVEPMGKKVREV